MSEGGSVRGESWARESRNKRESGVQKKEQKTHYVWTYGRNGVATYGKMVIGFLFPPVCALAIRNVSSSFSLATASRVRTPLCRGPSNGGVSRLSPLKPIVPSSSLPSPIIGSFSGMGAKPTLGGGEGASESHEPKACPPCMARSEPPRRLDRSDRSETLPPLLPPLLDVEVAEPP